LPEPVARGVVSLSEEEITLVLRVDVRHAVGVAHDLDAFGDAGHRQAVAVVVVVAAAARDQEEGRSRDRGQPVCAKPCHRITSSVEPRSGAGLH
jgi:hypothetical protein